MLLYVKPTGLFLTICMHVLLISMISRPMIFFPDSQYFVGLCAAEVITLCVCVIMILQLLINISFSYCWLLPTSDCLQYIIQLNNWHIQQTTACT